MRKSSTQSRRLFYCIVPFIILSFLFSYFPLHGWIYAPVSYTHLDVYKRQSIDGASKWQQFKKISFPLVKPTTVYVLTISIYAGLSMFLESYMLWKGNNSPQNIGLTIVGYLYRQGIEKRAMGYACAVGLVLLIVVMIVNLIQLTVTGTFKKEER